MKRLSVVGVAMLAFGAGILLAGHVSAQGLELSDWPNVAPLVYDAARERPNDTINAFVGRIQASSLTVAEKEVILNGVVSDLELDIGTTDLEPERQADAKRLFDWLKAKTTMSDAQIKTEIANIQWKPIE
jgi:hypothetical protein